MTGTADESEISLEIRTNAMSMGDIDVLSIPQGEISSKKIYKTTAKTSYSTEGGPK